jgi:UTP--glucose-1-phosphate uridylyltransferase
MPNADTTDNAASRPAGNASSLLPTTAIVPAAGFGTRLRPLTDAIPKEMLPVGRRLALEHIVDELKAAGITTVVFVLSPAKEAFIQKHFGEEADGMTFRYAIQPEMRGLGEAVLRAEPFVEGGNRPFIVALGDAVFDEPMRGGLTRRLAEAAAASDAAVGLVVQRVPRERISRYGVVTPADAAALREEDAPVSFAISDIVEKPAPEEAPSEFAAVARSGIFATLRETPPGKGGEIQLTDALRIQLREGRPGVAAPLQPGEVRHDIGSFDSYFRAFAAFALADPEQGEAFRAFLREQINVPGRFTDAPGLESN